jgi:hypothetical protein
LLCTADNTRLSVEKRQGDKLSIQHFPFKRRDHLVIVRDFFAPDTDYPVELHRLYHGGDAAFGQIDLRTEAGEVGEKVKDRKQSPNRHCQSVSETSQRLI